MIIRWLIAPLLLALAACAGQTTETIPALSEKSARAAPASVMRVHCIDVGQGAATLLEFSDGAVLVDTGGEDNDTVHSDDLLASYLDDFFSKRPDLNHRLACLFLTHPHLDHTRGVPVVLAHDPPRNVVTNGQTAGSGAEQQNALHDWALSHQVPIREIRLADVPAAGLTDEVIDPVHGTVTDPVITVLWGRVDADPGWGLAYNKPRFNNCNNHCIVVRIDFGKSSVLITGDLEEPAIKDLLRRYQGTRLLDADVYVVGHHGSINGTTPELVQAITPKLAVIECGTPDHETQFCAWAFGHPRQEIVAMLESGVSTSRVPKQVSLGWDAKHFEAATVYGGVYSTAWDGNLVFECRADGSISVAASEASLETAR